MFSNRENYYLQQKKTIKKISKTLEDIGICKNRDIHRKIRRICPGIWDEIQELNVS